MAAAAGVAVKRARLADGTLKRPIVAIDGPVGAGKSTVAKEVSRRLSFGFVDTGALYRCIALTSLKEKVGPSEDDKLKAIVDRVSIRFNMTEDGVNHVYLGDEDVTKEIRTEEVSMQASSTSSNPVVRNGLLGLQRRLGENGGVVLEGRDIGTVIFPGAECKIFLTADDKERAQRRFDELKAKGETPDFDKVLKDLKARDEADMNREVAPLKQADDAVLVDTSGMDFESVVGKIIDAVKSKM